MLQWPLHGFPHASAEYGAQAIWPKAINPASPVTAAKPKFWDRWRDSPITRLQIHCNVQNMRSAAFAKRLGVVYHETVLDDATFDDIYVKELSLLRMPCGERKRACQS